MKRAFMASAFFVLAAVFVGAQGNPFQGKVFYQSKTVELYEGSSALYAELVGRCSFLEKGVFRFEKDARPETSPQKSYQVLEYTLEKVDAYTFATINGKRYWIQNPLPGVYAFIGELDFGKGVFYGLTEFYLIDAALAKGTEWRIPREEFKW